MQWERILLLSGVIAAASSLASPTQLLGDGDSAELLEHLEDGRIVGGVAADWGEIPWQVSLQDNTRSQFCGGAILNREWIITAAHCSFINPANYRVVSGTLTFKSNGTVHVITDMIRHADYTSNGYLNDIAVWKVDPPFVWDEQTAPIRLPEPGVETPEGVNLTMSGWGDKSYGGQLSQVLLKTDAPVVSRLDCNIAYLEYGGIGPNMICTGLMGVGGLGPCQGDSGGGVTLDGELRGLVSWALGCAWMNHPAVLTEVSAFRLWITEQTGV